MSQLTSNNDVDEADDATPRRYVSPDIMRRVLKDRGITGLMNHLGGADFDMDIAMKIIHEHAERPRTRFQRWLQGWLDTIT